jgi:hypothetical protein
MRAVPVSTEPTATVGTPLNLQSVSPHKEMAMKKLLFTCGALLLIGGASTAQAGIATYNVLETFYEPETQPSDSIFKGSFDYDSVTQTVSNLHGILSESMTGSGLNGYPNDDMTWLSLTYQLSSVYDATLGGLLVTVFQNPTTDTFQKANGDKSWVPGGYVNYYGIPAAGNAYAMIFVNTTNPLAALTQAQVNKLAYADCTLGGMMGKTCMTGTTVAGYGRIGTMSGYPVSQTITLAPVPEPETYAMMLAGIGLLGFNARRRRQAVG